MSGKSNKELTLEELDMLSEAYLECRLSKIEEKELELVLVSTDVTSPAIEEARETMGIMTAVDSLRPDIRRKAPSWKSGRKWRWGVVVCVACIASIFMLNAFLPGILERKEDKDSELLVYIDGKRLTGELAEKKALEIERRCMEMYDKAIQNVEKREAEANRMINQKLHVE